MNKVTVAKPPGRNVYVVRFNHQGRGHKLSTRSTDPDIAKANAQAIYERVTKERRYLARTGRNFPRKKFEGIAPITIHPTVTGVYWAFCPLLPKFVKIGWASNIRKRMRHLQTGLPGPLLLLGYTEGAKRLEAELHSRLAEHRCRGEWFATCPAVVSAIPRALPFLSVTVDRVIPRVFSAKERT